MKNVKLTIIIPFLAMTFFANSKVVVFRTFEDFQNNKGEEYDDYHGYFHTGGSVKLVFKKSGKKTRIHCKEMWGFNYGDALFRIDKKHSQPTRVMNAGKIIYYENGIAHLSMIRDNSQSGSFSIGYYCYVSKNINSEMIPMPVRLISDARKRIKEFTEENPEYKNLFDCIEKNYNYFNVRPCVVAFEESN